MARKQRDDRLKQLVLLAFVAVNVLLVLLIWVDGLRADRPALPGYYRDVPAGAEESAPSRVTPFPEAGEEREHEDGEHRGAGQGAGRGRATATPLPESTEDLPILPSLDGDDA